MTNDPRRGVVSASEMPLVANCPFAHKAKKLALPLPASKDAETGTLGHAVLSDDVSADDVPLAVAETAEMCERDVNKLLADWLQEGEYQELKEVRYGITALGRVVEVTPESKADFIFTGQFDRLYIQGNRGLLIDFKTLFGKHAAALENEQLASLAGMVGEKHGLDALRIALVQPWKGKPTVCDYRKIDVLSAQRWTHKILAAEKASTPADRKAGPWCAKCDAAANCDTLRDHNHQQLDALNPMTIAGADPATQASAFFARAMELPAAKHAALVRGLPMIKRMVAAIEGSARVRAGEDPEFQQFYALKDKAGRRSISDVQAVWSRCAGHGVKADDFITETSVALGSVKDLLRKATGAKGKQLDALHDEVLAGAVDFGKPGQELVEVHALEG